MFLMWLACLLIVARTLTASSQSPIQNVVRIEQSDRMVQENAGERSEIPVAVVSWNLAEKSPSLRDCQFLIECGSASIIAVGIQELEDIRPRRKEGRRSRKWRKLRESFFPSKTFTCLGEHKMGGMHLAVYAKADIAKQVKAVQIIEVTCGVGNVMANKGAVCIACRLKNKKTIAFVNAHLAAHQNKVEERNLNYRRIAETIAEKLPPSWKRTTDSEHSATRSKRAPSVPDVTALFDSVFFLGDLNYRLDLPRLEVDLLCNYFGGYGSSEGSTIDRMQFQTKSSDVSSSLERVLQHDQLQREMKFGRVFANFKEMPIQFPPSFKYDKRSPRFDTKKGRAPAWTDRILYSASTRSPITPRSYYSCDVRTSDHRPVCASFDVQL